MSSPPPSHPPPQPRWIIAELDVHGGVDEHAAMCLGFAFEGAREAGARMVLVDLRELTGLDGPAIELFVRHDAACRASGVRLGLLLSRGHRQEPIADAFSAAGLGDRLQFVPEPFEPPAPTRRAPRLSARPRPRRATAHP